VLRTRAPVAASIATALPLDLHVLGLPLAFILSQDQTLHCKVFFDTLSIMMSDPNALFLNYIPKYVFSSAIHSNIPKNLCLLLHSSEETLFEFKLSRLKLSMFSFQRF
jgi:hypothetical protein